MARETATRRAAGCGGTEALAIQLETSIKEES
jgi:hypothetical protein